MASRITESGLATHKDQINGEQSEMHFIYLVGDMARNEQCSVSLKEEWLISDRTNSCCVEMRDSTRPDGVGVSDKNAQDFGDKVLHPKRS